MANTLNLGNGNWATKEDSLLAYNSENGNFKPLPFDFTRASSATVVNKAGLIETVGSGEPRIDFKDDAKGALLLEPTRINYIPYSTLDFDGGVKPNGWLIGFGTGSYSYEQLTYKGQKAVKQTQITTGRSYLDTGSITILANTEHTLKIQFILNECVADANDNILSFISFGASAIYKFSDIDSNGVLEIQFNPLSDNVGSLRIGLGVDQNATGSKSLAWAIPQLEQGSYATSYIPTQGSAVTRVADNAYQQSVTQVIGQSEGTMFIEFIPKDSSTLQILYQAKSSSGVVGQVDIRLQSGLIRTLANDGGGSQFFMNGGSYTVGTKYKVAVRYKLNDSKLYINGTDSGSDTSCSFTGSSLDQVSFAESLSSFLPSVDIIDSRLYNTALTDTELQALTRI